VAARRRLLPLEAIAGLNGFVLFFALPCMLYRFGATTPIAQLLDAGVFFTWLLCALVIVAFTVTISLNARIGWNDGAFGALVAAFPNTGFMGVPLLVALLGPRAAGPIIVTIMVDMVITTSLCIALSRLDSADEHGVAHAAQNALKGMLVNPLPWSILLGALASLFSLRAAGPGAQDGGPVGGRGLAGGAVHDRRGAGALADACGAARPPRRAADRLPAGGRDQAAACTPCWCCWWARRRLRLGCRWTGLRSR
jgi:malonate transporter